MTLITTQFNEGDDIIEISLSTAPFYGSNKKAYWGWMSTGQMLTEAQIILLQGSAEFGPGATIVADFRGGNTAPMYLYLAERESEPAKTSWFSNDFDKGDIGPGQAISVIGVVNGWRVYCTAFKTQFSSTTEFRIA